MNFKDYIKEAAAKAKKPEKPEETTAVMAFGRMNPPTVGHEKLINKLQDVASDHKGEAHLFTSHSQGTAKDPLDQKTKIGYLHSIVPASMQVHGSTKEKPTFLHAAAKLYAQGHRHLVMVAGSDRVDEYRDRLEKYNDGKEHAHGKYKFKSIKVVSAGQRDPDAEGVEGMSGTKMRDHARGNRIDKFKTGLPDALKSHAQEIANHIRAVKVKGVEIKEEADSIREAYINNLIYKMNDMVEANNGDRGPIVFRGSSYVTIQLKEGKSVKHWLKDIKEIIETNLNVATKPVQKYMEKQIPALFLSKEQFEEMRGITHEVKKEIQIPEVKETITMANLRNKLAENGIPIGIATSKQDVDIAHGLPDPMTAHRDINISSNKNIYFGIDKTIENQGHPGKPLGLVSFKTFISNPDVQAIELDKMEQEAEAQLSKTKLQQHTSAYNQMRKHKSMDHI